MTILIANESDIEELTQVEIESKKQSVPECISDIEINYSSRLHRWQTYFKGESPQSSKPDRLILKAMINNKIVGFIGGHLTTRYEMDAEIQSFYILKEHQRSGIGKKLLSKFLEWLLAHQAKSLCVGIEHDNKYQAFYLKYCGQHLNQHWIYWNDLTTLKNKIAKHI